MKSFRIIFAVLAATAAVVSCTKGITADKSDSGGDGPAQNGKITVNVEALMRIAVIGLDETIDKVDSVFLRGVNTVCSLKLDANASPEVSGDFIGTIRKTEAEGSRGQINDHGYVLIGGKRWATQNLTAKSGSPGDIPFNGAIVPGTVNEQVKVGDYFQWGASYTGYGVTENQDPDSLLIYSAISPDVKYDEYEEMQDVFA